MTKLKSHKSEMISRDEYIKRFSLGDYIKVADYFTLSWFQHMKRQGYAFVAYGTGQWVENSYLTECIWVFLGEFPIRAFPQNLLKLMNEKIVKASNLPVEKKFYSQVDFNEYLERNNITLTEPVEL